jgi:hypothetical protein
MGTDVEFKLPSPSMQTASTGNLNHIIAPGDGRERTEELKPRAANDETLSVSVSESA